MYATTLFIHSWLRWIVVLVALLAVLRASRGLRAARPWATGDGKLGRLLVGLIDLQFLLGLTLYVFLSPLVRSAFADFGAAMRSAPLRFFAIEHITAMLVAVALAHIGHARVLRAREDRKRHKNALFGSAGFLLLALIGMPWPVLKHGRPLFRSDLGLATTTSEQVDVPELFARRCAVCHGPRGHGDGLAAQAMQPRPRNFAEPSFQSSRTDEALRSVIKHGGTARALSASMPAHPDLSTEQVDALIRFIRSTRAR
jgi:uncharacterized membrane protein YozB (DUF420 family)